MADETPTSILTKYTNFVDIFSKNLTVELLKQIKISNHAINLIKNKKHDI